MELSYEIYKIYEKFQMNSQEIPWGNYTNSADVYYTNSNLLITW